MSKKKTFFIQLYNNQMENREDVLDAVEMKQAEKKSIKAREWISHTKLKQKLNLS